MDPDAALEIILDSEADSDQREDAIAGLKAWITRNGFLPTMTRKRWMGLLDLASKGLNK